MVVYSLRMIITISSIFINTNYLDIAILLETVFLLLTRTYYAGIQQKYNHIHITFHFLFFKVNVYDKIKV